jgi:hypothetical protein
MAPKLGISGLCDLSACLRLSVYFDKTVPGYGFAHGVARGFLADGPGKPTQSAGAFRSHTAPRVSPANEKVPTSWEEAPATRVPSVVPKARCHGGGNDMLGAPTSMASSLEQMKESKSRKPSLNQLTRWLSLLSPIIDKSYPKGRTERALREISYSRMHLA